MAIRIVTDSTADLPIPQAETLNITIVPITVFFGEEAYLDNVELDNAAFYRKLQASKELPRTSQPSPVLFQEAYQRLIGEGADGILSLHLSSKLSGTYQSACMGRDMLAEEARKIPIEVIDSQSVSIGMAYVLQRAVEEAKQGFTLAEIKTNMLDRLSRTRILCVLDTLEFIRRGGRINTAKAFLGNMLSVKPIISLKEGVVIPLEQPRTRNKAYARVAQLVEEMGALENMYIASANEEVGSQLAEALKVVYGGKIAMYKLGAALGTHTGPGTSSVSVVREHM